MSRLTGDITVDDWNAVLIPECGMDLDAYVRPVREFYARHPGADRNDWVRDFFLKTVGQTGHRTQARVEAFYRSDPYCRLLAHEWCGANILQGLLDGYTTPESLAEAPFVGAARVAAELGRPFRVLDFGCSRGDIGFVIAWLHPQAEVVLADFWTPPRRVLANGMSKYAPWLGLTFLDLQRDDIRAIPAFDYVNCREVLEHCFDPLEVVRRLYDSMRPGALAHISTWFDSGGGHDVQHLDEHAKYRDVPLWFAELASVGLVPCGTDPRGVVKLFRKGA